MNFESLLLVFVQVCISIRSLLAVKRKVKLETSILSETQITILVESDLLICKL